MPASVQQACQFLFKQQALLKCQSCTSEWRTPSQQLFTLQLLPASASLPLQQQLDNLMFSNTRVHLPDHRCRDCDQKTVCRVRLELSQTGDVIIIKCADSPHRRRLPRALTVAGDRFHLIAYGRRTVGPHHWTTVDVDGGHLIDDASPLQRTTPRHEPDARLLVYQRRSWSPGVLHQPEQGVSPHIAVSGQIPPATPPASSWTPPIATSCSVGVGRTVSRKQHLVRCLIRKEQKSIETLRLQTKALVNAWDLVSVERILLASNYTGVPGDPPLDASSGARLPSAIITLSNPTLAAPAADSVPVDPTLTGDTAVDSKLDAIGQDRTGRPDMIGAQKVHTSCAISPAGDLRVDDMEPTRLTRNGEPMPSPAQACQDRRNKVHTSRMRAERLRELTKANREAWSAATWSLPYGQCGDPSFESALFHKGAAFYPVPVSMLQTGAGLVQSDVGHGIHVMSAVSFFAPLVHAALLRGASKGVSLSQVRCVLGAASERLRLATGSVPRDATAFSSALVRYLTGRDNVGFDGATTSAVETILPVCSLSEFAGALQAVSPGGRGGMKKSSSSSGSLSYASPRSWPVYPTPTTQYQRFCNAFVHKAQHGSPLPAGAAPPVPYDYGTAVKAAEKLWSTRKADEVFVGAMLKDAPAPDPSFKTPSPKPGKVKTWDKSPLQLQAGGPGGGGVVNRKKALSKLFGAIKVCHGHEHGTMTGQCPTCDDDGEAVPPLPLEIKARSLPASASTPSDAYVPLYLDKQSRKKSRIELMSLTISAALKTIREALRRVRLPGLSSQQRLIASETQVTVGSVTVCLAFLGSPDRVTPEVTAIAACAEQISKNKDFANMVELAQLSKRPKKETRNKQHMAAILIKAREFARAARLALAGDVELRFGHLESAEEKVRALLQEASQAGQALTAMLGSHRRNISKALDAARRRQSSSLKYNAAKMEEDFEPFKQYKIRPGHKVEASPHCRWTWEQGMMNLMATDPMREHRAQRSLTTAHVKAAAAAVRDEGSLSVKQLLDVVGAANIRAGEDQPVRATTTAATGRTLVRALLSYFPIFVHGDLDAADPLGVVVLDVRNTGIMSQYLSLIITPPRPPSRRKSRTHIKNKRKKSASVHIVDQEGPDGVDAARTATPAVGRPRISDSFPDIISTLMEYVQNSGEVHAQGRRRDAVLRCGRTVEACRKHLLKNIPGLKTISWQTVRRLTIPPKINTTSARRHHNEAPLILNQRPAANDKRADNPNSHYCNAEVKITSEAFAFFSGEATLMSCDDLAKIKVGIPAVSQYHRLSGIVAPADIPVVPDHAFPAGNRYLLTPAGYVWWGPPEQLDRGVDPLTMLKRASSSTDVDDAHEGEEAKGSQVEESRDADDDDDDDDNDVGDLTGRPTHPKMFLDRHGRPHVAINGKRHSGGTVCLRPAKFSPMNISLHAEDFSRAMEQMAIKNPALAGRRSICLTTDGANDFQPCMEVNLLFFWRMYKLHGLEFFAILRYAPGWSFLNKIERCWSNGSKLLGGEVLSACFEDDPRPPSQMGLKDKREQYRREETVFHKAALRVQEIWTDKDQPFKWGPAPMDVHVPPLGQASRSRHGDLDIVHEALGSSHTALHKPVNGDPDAESRRLELLSIVDGEYREALSHVSRGVHSIMFAPCDNAACHVSACVSKRNGTLASTGLARFFSEPEVGNRPPLVVPSRTHEGHYRTFLEGYGHLLFPYLRITPAQAAERVRNLKHRTDEWLPSRKEQFSDSRHALAPGYCDFGHDGSPEEGTSERCSRHFTFLSKEGKKRHQKVIHWDARKARMRSSKSKGKGRAKNAAAKSTPCSACGKEFPSKRALARHKKASPACHRRRRGPVKLKGPFQKGQVIDEARAGRLKEDSELISSVKIVGDDSADEEAFDLMFDMKVGSDGSDGLPSGGDGAQTDGDDEGDESSRAAAADVDYFGFASYIPERVLDSKVDETGTSGIAAASRSYRVKWKGFSPDQASWKSAVECQADPALRTLVAEFRKRPAALRSPKPSRSSSAPTPGMRRQLSIGDSFRRAPGSSQPRDAGGAPITIDRVHADLRHWFPSNPMSDLRPLDARSPGMLTDAVVNAACEVYSDAYCTDPMATLSGFQNTTMRDVSNGWNRHDVRPGLAAINVLNTGSLHWFTAGQTKVPIYDVSAGEHNESRDDQPTVRHFALDSYRAGDSVLSLPEEVQWDICQLYGKPSDACLSVAYPRPHQQLGSVHCGGYALAFMWAFCEGHSLTDIVNMVFDQSTLYATVWATLCTGQVVPFEYRMDRLVGTDADDGSGTDTHSPSDLCVRSLVRADLKGVPARRQSRARSRVARSKKTTSLKRTRSAPSALDGNGSATSALSSIARSKPKRRKTTRILSDSDDNGVEGAKVGNVTDVSDADHEPPLQNLPVAAGNTRRGKRRRNKAGASESPSLVESSFDWLEGLSDDEGQTPAAQVLSSSDEQSSADRVIHEQSTSLLLNAEGVEPMETDSVDGEDRVHLEVVAPEESGSQVSRKRRRASAVAKEVPQLKSPKHKMPKVDGWASKAAADRDAALGAPYVCPGCAKTMSSSGSHSCRVCGKSCHPWCFAKQAEEKGFGAGGTCPSCVSDTSGQPLMPAISIPQAPASALVAPVEVGARDGGSGSTSSASSDDDMDDTKQKPLDVGSIVGIYAGRLSEEPFFLGKVIADPSISEDGSVDIHWFNIRDHKYELMGLKDPEAKEPVYRASIFADGLTLVDGRLQPNDAELVMEAVLGGVTKEDATPDGYDIVSQADFESLLDQKHSGSMPKALRSKHILIHSKVTGYDYGRIDTCKGTTVEGSVGVTVGVRYPVDPNDPTGTRHSAKKWKKLWYLGFDVNLFRHTYSVPSLSNASPGWVLLKKKRKEK
jgi:hypothetical protein